MIEIADIRVKDVLDKARLYCDLIVDNEKHSIWFEFDNQYKQYICTERIDGIVVNILLYCMENGHSITSDIPISEKLYYQMVNFLIPTIANNIKEYSKIKINAPINSVPLKSKNAVGTGCSGGVDSFYTILKNIDKPTKSFNITHLTFFNAGASGNFGGDKARDRFHKRLEVMKNISGELNLPLIAVDTNINEFLHQMHECTHTFRSLAIPLLLQKLFSIYYYSSGVEFADMHFSYADTAYYDLLNCMCLTNENITFYPMGSETNRIGKIESISESEIVEKYLNVCVKESVNCGLCEKCKRTLLEIYSLNKLNNFERVFNVNVFLRNKNKYIGEALAKKNSNIFSREVCQTFKKNKVKIPFSSKFFWHWYYKANMFMHRMYNLLNLKVWRKSCRK